MSDPRDLAHEQRCLAIGEVVAQTLPAPDGAPGGLPPELADAFAGVPPRRRRWGRPIALSFLAAAAAAGVAVWLTVRARPIEFAVDGAVAEADGFFEASPSRAARARFSDGTIVSVAPGGAAQVKSRTHDGATVSMTRGSASFAVKHRPNASWHVEVGRFDIAVTGTEFEVRDANPAEGFELRMKSGAVIVRGPLTGDGIPLYGGQRLVASLARRTLVVGEVERIPVPPSPVRAIPVIESREEPPRRPRPRAKPVTLAAAEPPAAVEAPVLPSIPVQPPRFEPLPEPPVAHVPPSTPQPPSVEPTVAPPPPLLAVGGSSCNEGPAAQISFDRPGELTGVGAGPRSAMANPAIDATHSWCGGHSLRFDLDFNGVRPLEVPFRESGTPFQSGDAILRLPQPVDLRGRTVIVHFYVDAPADVSFDARVLGEDVGRRTGHTYAPGLVPGKWYAVSATFRGPSQSIFEPKANVADASHIDSLVVRIDSTGDRRTWSGTIYIDDVSWR